MALGPAAGQSEHVEIASRQGTLWKENLFDDLIARQVHATSLARRTVLAEHRAPVSNIHSRRGVTTTLCTDTRRRRVIDLSVYCQGRPSWPSLISL
jgi:hypothetical protein